MREVLKEAEAITDVRHDGHRHATGITQYFAQKRFCLCLIDRWLRCHVQFSLCLSRSFPQKEGNSKSCEAAVLAFTELVCTKTVEFLFVKTRRILSTWHEDFCEEDGERYVALTESDRAAFV